MKALLKTTDPLLVGYVIDLLSQEEIKAFEFDANVSIVEGSIGIFPRRVMVSDDEFAKARDILLEAGLRHELEA